jgi:rubrerythrin
MKQKLITEYFQYSTKKLEISDPKFFTGYNPKTNEWHCLECGISMGKNNPRQLCGKILCYNAIY